jgi:hypothetical protein
MSDKETTKNLLRNNTCENCRHAKYREDIILYCAIDDSLDPRVNPASITTPWLNSCKYWKKDFKAQVKILF